jgi:hypothetical protein
MGEGVWLARGSQSIASADIAARMVRTREVIDPRPDRTGSLCAPFLRLTDEVERRGRLEMNVADHAGKRAAS